MFQKIIRKVVHHTISREVYRALEDKLRVAPPSYQTTDIQAGFQLGVEHTLRLLRDGWVTDAPSA